MAIEGRRDAIIYKIVVPVVGAIAGAIVATWLGAANADNAQLSDVVSLLKDPSLSAQQKLQALEIYKDITDRPWSVIRSLVTTLTVVGGAIGMAYAIRIQNR